MFVAEDPNISFIPNLPSCEKTDKGDDLPIWR